MAFNGEHITVYAP